MITNSQQLVARPMKPTRPTVFMRVLWPWQLLRFVLINLRMTAMILKSHHTRLPRA